MFGLSLVLFFPIQTYLLTDRQLGKARNGYVCSEEPIEREAGRKIGLDYTDRRFKRPTNLDKGRR